MLERMKAKWTWAVGLAAGLAGVAAGSPEEYAHPQGWRSKTVALERVEGEHDGSFRTGWLSLKDFGASGAAPELHVRMPDGTDCVLCPRQTEYAVRRSEVVGCQAGQVYVPPSQSTRTPDCQWVRFGWTPAPFLGEARPGDVFPAYIAFDADGRRWAGREFALRCGGKGRHAGCSRCFLIVPAAKAKAQASAAQASAPPRGDAPPALSVPLFPVPARLGTATPVYALHALPYMELAETLPAGTELLVLGRLPPCYLHVRYSPSGGAPREGAVFETEGILP